MKNLLQHTRRTLQQNHCLSLLPCLCVYVSVSLSHAPCSLFFSCLSLALLFFSLFVLSLFFSILFLFATHSNVVISLPLLAAFCSLPRSLDLRCCTTQTSAQETRRAYTLSPRSVFLCRSFEKSLTS